MVCPHAGTETRRKRIFDAWILGAVLMSVALVAQAAELKLPLLWTTNCNTFLESAATVADINGKILTTQQKGNTGEQMTRDVLKVYGLDYAKLRKVNFGSYNDSVEQLKDGHAQVFALITTIPASAVMDIGTSRKINIVAVPDDKLRALQKINKGYDKRIIKAGTYSGMDKDVQTIGTWTHLMMRCSTPEDLVYKITKSLAANTSELGHVVAAVKGLTAKDLAIDVGVPYHPGARKYYREAKVL